MRNENDRAAAIVLRNNMVLLIYRRTDGREYYVFPGGHIEANETREKAVVREINEEASIQVQAERLLYRLHHDKLKIPDVHYYFLCRYLSGTPKLREDTNEYRENREGHEYHEPVWFAVSDLPDAVAYPLEVRDRLLADLKSQFSTEVVDLQYVGDPL